MAGLCGLKIVLLWTGIISLTDYNKLFVNTYTEENRVETQHGERATSISNPSRSPQCFYTVTATRFGFQLNITSSIAGTSYMSLNEEGRPETTTYFIVHHFGQTSSHSFSQQKPCTAYEHTVTLTDGSGGETLCDGGDKTLVTNKMDKDDIKRTSCNDGSVCYRSHWDISSSLQTLNKNPAESCRSDNKTICIKPDYDDICSDLTTTFTSGNCVKSSFNITTNIPVDFLVPNEIKQEFQNQLPAKIITEFPPKCVDLSVDYICQENGKSNESKKLSELEPFTDYSCTGQVNNNNVTITNTTTVDVLINCDIEIKLDKGKQKTTNTSIDLSWTTISQNCQDVPTLEKLAYDCSCSPAASKWKHSVTGEVKKHPAGGSCRAAGLEPFTDYTCDIQPKYNKEDFEFRFEVKQKTEIGIPEDIDKLTVDVPEPNVIKVTCDYKNKKFNGPEGKFLARLSDGSGTERELKLKKCDFEFKDLNDSTTYTVKVTAFNGKFESNPKTEDVSTIYNDSFIIRLFSYIAFIIYVVLNVMIYKIYVWRLRKSINVNEDVMLDSTAGYENDPQSEERL